MPTDAGHPTPIDVAIGIVVEKMSIANRTIDREQSDSEAPCSDQPQLHFLITRRRADQVLGGYWELPGGKIEPGETPAEAVIRELREEVAIDVTPIDTLPTVAHTYDHASIRLLPSICQRTAGIPQAIEVADVRWVTPQELSQYTFPQASLPVIASLLNWLAQPSTPSTQNPTHG